jgi:hypothetical protein
VLVRFGHKFAVGEDTLLSRPANVSMAKLFSSHLFRIKEATELGLSAVPLRQSQRLQWKVAATAAAAPHVHVPAAAPTAPAFAVELTAMNIRTFLLEVQFQFDEVKLEVEK